MRTVRSLVGWILLAIIPFLGVMLFPLWGNVVFAEDVVDQFMTGGGFTIVMIIGSVGLGAVVMVLPFRLIRSVFGGLRRTKALLAQGRPATAVVTRLGENSMGGTMRINGQPVVNLEVDVYDPERGEPYTVAFDTVVSQLALPQVQPGCILAVAVDRKDPQKLAIDWQRAPPPVTLGGTGDTSDVEYIHERGEQGLARPLQVDRNAPGEDGAVMATVRWEVYLSHQRPYIVEKEKALPRSAVHMLEERLGVLFPVTVHPTNREKIVVTIEER